MSMIIDSNTDFFYPVDSIKGLKEKVVIPCFEHAVKGAIYTIAITVYRRSLFLKQCLDSAIRQDTKIPYEIIVVNDDPSADSPIDALMSCYRNTPIVSYYKKKVNEGLMDNMNRSIVLSKTEWVLLIHDDDWLCPDYLQKIHSYRDRYKQYSIYVPSHTTYYFGKFVETKGRFREYICKMKKCWGVCPMDFVNGTCVTPTGTLYNRKSFVMSGGFAKQYGMAADYVFFARYSSEGRILRINEKLFHYRFAENESLRPETIANFKLIGHFLSVFLMNRYTVLCGSFRRQYEKVRLWRDFSGDVNEMRRVIGGPELSKYENEHYRPIVFHLFNVFCKTVVFFR